MGTTTGAPPVPLSAPNTRRQAGPRAPRTHRSSVVEELAGVLGIAAGGRRCRAVRDVYSGQTGVDPNEAPDGLVHLLSRGAQEGGGLNFKQALTSGTSPAG